MDDEQRARISEARRDWQRQTMRVQRSDRAICILISQVLGVNFDGVTQLALRYYTRKHGVDLPGWLPVPTVGHTVVTIIEGGRHPRLWVAMPQVWHDRYLPKLERGEIRTPHGVVREALRAFYEDATGETRHDPKKLNAQQIRAATRWWAEQMEALNQTAEIPAGDTTR